MIQRGKRDKGTLPELGIVVLGGLEQLGDSDTMVSNFGENFEVATVTVWSVPTFAGSRD